MKISRYFLLMLLPFLFNSCDDESDVLGVKVFFNEIKLCKLIDKYTYDELGRVKTVRKYENTPANYSYEYDESNRIVSYGPYNFIYSGNSIEISGVLEADGRKTILNAVIRINNFDKISSVLIDLNHELPEQRVEKTIVNYKYDQNGLLKETEEVRSNNTRTVKKYLEFDDKLNPEYGIISAMDEIDMNEHNPVKIIDLFFNANGDEIFNDTLEYRNYRYNEYGFPIAFEYIVNGNEASASQIEYMLECD